MKKYIKAKKNKMKGSNNCKINLKKMFLVIIVVTILSIVLFFIINKKMINVFKNGNTKTSQEIVDYILNINSYEATITAEIKSNKNNNKYLLKQYYIKPNISVQEVIEPANISGIKITNNGTNLKIENSNLKLSSLFENYNYLGNNVLDLISFINDYKETNESKFEENNSQIIMTTKNKNSNNKYINQKILYVDKNSYKPIKLEVKDFNQKTIIYILYNEVKINSTHKEDALAKY